MRWAAPGRSARCTDERGNGWDLRGAGGVNECDVLDLGRVNSAVLAALFEEDDETRMVFTRRA